MTIDMRAPWPGRRAGRRRARIDLIATIAILFVVTVAPIPLGGVSPAMWPIFSAIVGVCIAAYAFRYWQLGVSFSVPFGAIGIEAALWLGLCLFAATQALPLGQLLGAAVFGNDGTKIALDTLSLTPGTTSMVTLQLFSYGGMAWLSTQVSSHPRRARILQVGIVAIATGIAIYGLVALTQWDDTILGAPKWAYQGSATASFVNRNTFATFLAIGLANAVAFLFSEFGRSEKAGNEGLRALLATMPALACCIAILCALIATNSRMGLLAGGLGSLLVVALSVLRGGWLRAIAVLGGIVLVVGTGLWLYGSGLMERLSSVERDFDVRGDLYQQVVALISQRPFLGYGGGSFEYAFPLVHHLPVSSDLVWNRAHSTYLALWAEFGVFAGSLPVLMLALVFCRLIIAHVRSALPDSQRIAAAGAILVVAIHSLTDFSLEIQAVAYLFAAVLGGGLSTLTRRSGIGHA